MRVNPVYIVRQYLRELRDRLVDRMLVRAGIVDDDEWEFTESVVVTEAVEPDRPVGGVEVPRNMHLYVHVPSGGIYELPLMEGTRLVFRPGQDRPPVESWDWLDFHCCDGDSVDE